MVRVLTILFLACAAEKPPCQLDPAYKWSKHHITRTTPTGSVTTTEYVAVPRHGKIITHQKHSAKTASALPALSLENVYSAKEACAKFGLGNPKSAMQQNAPNDHSGSVGSNKEAHDEKADKEADENDHLGKEGVSSSGLYNYPIKKSDAWSLTLWDLKARTEFQDRAMV